MLTTKDFERLATMIGHARAHRQVGLDPMDSLEDSLMEWCFENPRFDLDKMIARISQRQAESVGMMAE